MMHMTFYWGKEVTLLFSSWKTTTWLTYALSLLVCLVAPILYQFLENLRIRLKLIGIAAQSSASAETVESPLLQSKVSERKRSAAKISGAVLFGVNSAIGYLLMLAVMSFNGGVFIAVVLGLAIGYFLFRIDDENLKDVDNPCACA